jgi:L-aspartate oxidase
MVFGHRAYLDSIEEFKKIDAQPEIPDWDTKGTNHPRNDPHHTKFERVQLLMSDYVGIVRTDVRLQRAMKRLDLLWQETEDLYKTTTVSPNSAIA